MHQDLMQRRQTLSQPGMVEAYLFEKWGSLLATCQLENHALHVRDGRIYANHLEAILIGCLSGVSRAWIDQDRPAGWGEMFCASMRKRLKPSSDDADDVIIMAMTWKGVLDVISLQSPDVKLGIMPDFGPFFGLHFASRIPVKKPDCRSICY